MIFDLQRIYSTVDSFLWMIPSVSSLSLSSAWSMLNEKDGENIPNGKTEIVQPSPLPTKIGRSLCAVWIDVHSEFEELNKNAECHSVSGSPCIPHD